MTHVASAADEVARLWRDAAGPEPVPTDVDLPGDEPLLPSSFPVATALQASVAACALAAAEWGRLRGGPVQRVSVDGRAAVREASGWFRLDGRVPDLWDPLSGLYRCGGGGWVRVHANFAHHRESALRVLGLLDLPAGAARDGVARALRGWRSLDFEQAATEAGGVVAAVRSFAEWDAHPHAPTVAAAPLVDLQRVGSAAPPALRPWSAAADRPLRGVRVLDLTRILAGPVAGRTLAAHGADVLMVNGPHLPNIEAIADVSRGKRSCHVDLREAEGRDRLRELVRGADVFLQGYRPGALAARGFGPDELQRINPSLVCVSLSAYGEHGPWGGRRGFDSLVQSATGFNLAEAEAFGAAEPKALPLQALDYGAGFLLAFGTIAALLRRQREGGGMRVAVTLARTGLWLRGLGRCSGFADVKRPSLDGWTESHDSGFGRLEAVPHAAQLSHTPPHWERPSMPPGTHRPEWLPR